MAPTFVRSTVREMAGYAPGEQPSAAARVVKLNTNENPFPPSPKVMAAIRGVEAESLRRYPNPDADPFRDAAAKLHGVSRDMIMAGNGSDDVLTIATRTFIPPGGSLAYPDPTYSLYPVLAQLQDARPIAVPWDAGYRLPIDALAATQASAIYLANPNAPTGTLVPATDISKLAAKFDGLVLVDEAYVDFAEEHCLSLLEDRPNVVVTRSLSKSYSLAGLRFGYAVAQPQVIAEMMKVKDSYNTDAISVAAATAAIGDQEYARTRWAYVREERKKLSDELNQAGWSVLPSQANFILVNVPGGRGRDAYHGLKQQGILVRFFEVLPDKIRITIGQSHENNALLAGVKALGFGTEKAAENHNHKRTPELVGG
jgi:histidinol-phosphate aminotransferase